MRRFCVSQEGIARLTACWNESVFAGISFGLRHTGLTKLTTNFTLSCYREMSRSPQFPVPVTRARREEERQDGYAA
jgi:hypothetical protein